MKLKDLIESCLIKDDHHLIISQRIAGYGRSVTRGNWYQDNVLDCLDREIFGAHYKDVDGGRWYIELTDIREG